MKEPKLKYEPESKIEIYYFNKWQGAKAEMRHLKFEQGKDKAYIQELEHELSKWKNEWMQKTLNHQTAEIIALRQKVENLKNLIRAKIA